MNGVELFLLGRRLTKIGQEAIPAGAGFHRLPSSVRSVLIDVFEHPASSIGDITARTGFPQSLVSVSVARLRGAGVLVTEADTADRRRTLVRPAPGVVRQVAQAWPTVDTTIGHALGTDDAGEVAEIVSALELLARRLTPDTLARVRSGTEA